MLLHPRWVLCSLKCNSHNTFSELLLFYYVVSELQVAYKWFLRGMCTLYTERHHIHTYAITYIPVCTYSLRVSCYKHDHSTGLWVRTSQRTGHTSYRIKAKAIIYIYILQVVIAGLSWQRTKALCLLVFYLTSYEVNPILPTFFLIKGKRQKVSCLEYPSDVLSVKSTWDNIVISR